MEEGAGEGGEGGEERRGEVRGGGGLEGGDDHNTHLERSLSTDSRSSIFFASTSPIPKVVMVDEGGGGGVTEGGLRSWSVFASPSTGTEVGTEVVAEVGAGGMEASSCETDDNSTRRDMIKHKVGSSFVWWEVQRKGGGGFQTPLHDDG